MEEVRQIWRHIGYNKSGGWSTRTFYAQKLLHHLVFIEETSIYSKCQSRRSSKENTDSTSQSPVHSDSLPTFPLPKITWLSTGFIRKKYQCVWCRKKEGKKHPKHPSSKLLRIEQSSRWQGFKRHVPFLKETSMQRKSHT